MSPAQSSGGQTLDSIVKNKMPAIGIDLGGTKLSAAIVVDYNVVSEPYTVPTPHGPDNIVDAIVNLIQKLQKDYPVVGAGIATAGCVDPDTGDILGATNNLPGWTGTPLKKIIESRTLLPIHVENDANAATYGEAMAMQMGDKDCVVGITLGTGIGTGIVMKGQLYRGAHFVAAEGGHIKISMGNNRMCTCGLFDCWEAYGCGHGLVMTAQELLTGVTVEQSDLAKNIQNLTSRVITVAAANGDIIGQKAINQWHEHVAVGIATLSQILDPDCFILSGGMSEIVDLELLTELVQDRCLARNAESMKILRAQLGIYAGIIGAAHVVLNSINSQ